MKRTFLIVASILLCVVLFAACSEKTEEPAASEEANAEASASEKSQEDNTVYCSASDWETASDAEKLEVAKELMVKITPYAENLSDEELERSAEAFIPTIEAFFQGSPDGDLADLNGNPSP